MRRNYVLKIPYVKRCVNITLLHSLCKHYICKEMRQQLPSLAWQPPVHSANLAWQLPVHSANLAWQLPVHSANLAWQPPVHSANLAWQLPVHSANLAWQLQVYQRGQMCRNFSLVLVTFGWILAKISKVAGFWSRTESPAACMTLTVVWNFSSCEHNVARKVFFGQNCSFLILRTIFCYCGDFPPDGSIACIWPFSFCVNKSTVVRMWCSQSILCRKPGYSGQRC